MTYEEPHGVAYEEAVTTAVDEEALQYQVRNVFSAKKVNVLTLSYST